MSHRLFNDVFCGLGGTIFCRRDGRGRRGEEKEREKREEEEERQTRKKRRKNNEQRNQQTRRRNMETWKNKKKKHVKNMTLQLCMSALAGQHCIKRSATEEQRSPVREQIRSEIVVTTRGNDIVPRTFGADPSSLIQN